MPHQQTSVAGTDPRGWGHTLFGGIRAILAHSRSCRQFYAVPLNSKLITLVILFITSLKTTQNAGNSISKT